VADLPKDGPLFRGLKRRASKGGKIGARLGDLFRDQLAARLFGFAVGTVSLTRAVLCPVRVSQTKVLSTHRIWLSDASTNITYPISSKQPFPQ
jgi:hypothetical protein